jgi:hypothetical protein
MEWIFAAFVFVFMCMDSRYLGRDNNKSLPLKPKPFDDIGWRKENGLPITDAEVEALYRQYKNRP